MSHVFLALSCIALIGAIAAQDYLVPSLRNATISSGLTGPYHWVLDGTYVVLAAALCIAFTRHHLMEALAVISAIALILTAATNTFWQYVDKLTNGQHSLWHSRFTIAVFVSALLLQIVGDKGKLWMITVATVALPAAAYAYFHFYKATVEGISIAASPAAEKLYVLCLCVWLIVAR